MSGSSFATALDDLALASRILYHHKIVDGYGHISARDPRDLNRFLLSRAKAPGLVTKDDILTFGLDGQAIERKQEPVFYERFIHSEIYRARPDVQAVVHSHSPTVIPFSVAQTPLRPINASFFYPDVPVFDTREVAGPTNLLISNADLGRALARSLANNTVILLRGHGNAVVGPNIRLAVYRAIYTELNARLLLNSITLGGPVNYLSPDEAALIEQSMNTHRPGHGWDRNWEIWAAEAMAASTLKT